jgi:hypothetical protein
MGNWRVTLTVTEQHLEATHARTSERFLEVEANDELNAVNAAIAAVFAEAAKHRSWITGIAAEHPLEMP